MLFSPLFLTSRSATTIRTRPAAAPTSGSRCTSHWAVSSLSAPSLAASLCIPLFLSLTLSYGLFRKNGACMGNIIMITLTLLMGLSCLGFSLTEKINRGLLPPATFFLVIVFYLVSAMLASPNGVEFDGTLRRRTATRSCRRAATGSRRSTWC